MPSKYYLRNFQEDHFYHIFNRGAAKQDIFLRLKDYDTFTSTLQYYIQNPIGNPLSYLREVSNPGQKSAIREVRNLQYKSEMPVKLISYCLMPNHFHLLLKQSNDDKSTNITNLMRRLSITYSMYFNHTHERSGALLQGKYKNAHITTDEQLIHASKYIHLNPKPLLKPFQKLEAYPHSSYPYFIDPMDTPNWINTNEILETNYFKNSSNPHKDYKQFINHSPPNPSKFISIE